MSSNSWWWWVLAIAIVIAFALYGQIGQQRDAKLRTAGLQASAKVISVRQTGTWVANNPEVEFELEVQRSGAEPYVLKSRAVVPQVHLAAVQPGTTLHVRVAANDPQRIVLDEAWAH